jgi:cytochrome c oxidase subunit 2
MMSPRRLRTLSALPALVLVAAGCDATPLPVGMERGAELFETCQPCHGSAGEGNVAIASPAIAGLPQWYVESQLQSFQNGWRGKHAEDLPGLRMRPMAVSLNRDGDIASVAAYAASLEAPFPPSTLHGNAGAGAAQYEQVCVACHGPDGRGNELLRSPPIVQLQDWYLLQELQNFRTGARGTHPDDVWGATMRVNSVLLSDQAMQDVLAYVQTLR